MRRTGVFLHGRLGHAAYVPSTRRPFEACAGRCLSVHRYTVLSRTRSLQKCFMDWHTVADDTAAALRIHADQTPTGRQLIHLVSELATRSDASAARWAKHNVRFHRAATKAAPQPRGR